MVGSDWSSDVCSSDLTFWSAAPNDGIEYLKDRPIEPRFDQDEVDRLRASAPAATTPSEVEQLRLEVEALKRENDGLRAQVDREQSLVDRLLQVPPQDADVLRSKSRLLGRTDSGDAPG